jgi:enoyl-CoA hydratase
MSAFEITRDGAVAHLRLSRPESSNALDLSFWRHFGPALRALDATGEVRALVISGEGRNFCAGMDISVFSGGAILQTDTPAERQAFHQAARELQETLTTIERVRFPVIAAVQGACVGAGLDMVSACDLRLAAEGAYFRIEEINIGMMADVGSLQRLPHILPEAVVRELAYLGTSLTADRASSTPSCRTPRPFSPQHWKWRMPSPPRPRWRFQAPRRRSPTPVTTRWPRGWSGRR